MKYNKKFQEIIEKLELIDDEECKNIKEDVQLLSDIYTKKETRLNKIVTISDKQQRAILELHEELDRYKNNLEKKVEEEIKKRKQQEDLLFEQTRLAMIAEMVDAVAHQWIQPLNIISLNTELLSLEAKKNNGVTSIRVDDFKEISTQQINHLLDTLNNFRSFFRPIKELQTFSISNALNSVLNLVNDELVKYSIKVHVDTNADFSISGNENEFKHIILNFISNSKYAFLKNKIKPRIININILKKEKKLEYIDNAGGIKEDILDTIFDMHTSTKGDEGSGIGLYMSQQIAQKHNGELSVQNIPNGAKFTFIYKGNL